MKLAQEYRVTVRIAARDLPKLIGNRVHLGLTEIAVEEVTPAGWTRRVPDRFAWFRGEVDRDLVKKLVDMRAL